MQSNIQLLQGNCLSLMNDIPNESVNLICADLPFGVTANPKDIPIPLNDYIQIGKRKYNSKEFVLYCWENNYSKEYFADFWKSEHSKGLWSSYERIIKPNGMIALFGQGTFYVDLVNSNPKMFRYDLVWDKVLSTGFLNSKRCPLRVHEQVACFYKKQPTYNPQFTVGKPLHSKGKNFASAEIKNQNYGAIVATDDKRAGSTEKYPTSIQRFAKPHPSKAKHRTQKSIEFLEWIIKTYSNEGDVVLDNCMGSGGCGVAARKNNRKFIGMEMDSEEFDNSLEFIGSSLDIDFNHLKNI